MTTRGSRRIGLLTVLGSAMLLGLSACGVPKTQESMNIHGVGLDEDTKARVERLVSYCQKLSDGGNFYLSAGMCRRAHDLDPTNPLPLMVMADNFERYEKYDDALQAYGTVLENHPKSVEAAHKLAKLQLAQGHDNAAFKTLQDSLVHNPNESKLLNIMGVVKDKQGDHEMAQFYYRESLAQDPDNVSVSNNLGLSLALSGKPDEAVQILNDVVENPAAPSTSRSNLALAYAAADAQAASEASASANDSDDQQQDSKGVTDETSEYNYSKERAHSTGRGSSFETIASNLYRESGRLRSPGQPLPLLTTSFAQLPDPALEGDFDLPAPSEDKVEDAPEAIPLWGERRLNKR